MAFLPAQCFPGVAALQVCSSSSASVCSGDNRDGLSSKPHFHGSSKRAVQEVFERDDYCPPYPPNFESAAFVWTRLWLAACKSRSHSEITSGMRCLAHTSTTAYSKGMRAPVGGMHCCCWLAQAPPTPTTRCTTWSSGSRLHRLQSAGQRRDPALSCLSNTKSQPLACHTAISQVAPKR